MQQAQTATSDSATQQVFHQEADTFDLTATLTDHKLAVVLKDYVDWVIYQKEYIEDDIGEDIHKKMDLKDVYEVFASSVESEDTEMMEYEFGKIIGNDDASCYKIEKGGKITIYYGLTNNKNQQVNFESQLVLLRGREVSQIQRSEVKLAVKVMHFSKKIERMNQEKERKAKIEMQRELAKIEMQRELAKIEMQRELAKIEMQRELAESERQRELSDEKERRKGELDERKKLQQRMEKIEQNHKQFVVVTIAAFIGVLLLAVLYSWMISSAGLSQAISAVKVQNTKKVNNLNQNLTEAIERINHDLLTQVKDLQTTLKALREQITKSREDLKGIREQLINEIRDTEQELSEKLQNQSQETSLKLEEYEQALNPVREINQIHSLEQNYEVHFKIEGARVKHTDGPIWHPYVFNYPIRHNESAKFMFKITRTWGRQIMVGVVDWAEQKNERKFHESASAMTYYGQEGRKYPSNTCQGSGFRQGDLVEVRVDRTSAGGYIAWYVNGQLEASLNGNILADKMRVLMPYVQMWNSQDTVEWIVGDHQL